jgi:hypothetical protein
MASKALVARSQNLQRVADAGIERCVEHPLRPIELAIELHGFLDVVVRR